MSGTELTLRSPLYERVREQLRERCLEEAGGMLPSLRQLSEDMEVNHLTISRALRDLEAEGIVEIVPRKGTFINSAPARQEKVELVSFYSERQQLFDIAAFVMRGMELASRGTTVHGRTISVPPVPTSEAFLKQLRAQKVDAVVFLGTGYLPYPDSFREAQFIYEVASELPVIIAGCPLEGLHLDCVYGDPRPQLQEYLLRARQKGMNRFAYLGSHIQRIHFQERVRVFQEFLLDHGIACNRRYMPPEGDATQVVQELLALNERPEVIVAANLHYALTAVMEAQRLNLEPGKDIHILCFASIEEDARPILPYATVILLDEVAMGR